MNVPHVSCLISYLLLSFRGFSPEDLPQQRRAFQQDDVKGAPLQRNGISRPSGRHIYMQRKEYSESLNRQPDNFHVRVEHLFTCELDGQEVKTVDNCVSKLKRLDAKGRLWPQEMIMEVQGGYLMLSDIETKTELESVPLSSITQTKAVLDSCAYNSVLAITVQERSKRIPQVFMFQCEETGVSAESMNCCPLISFLRSDLENIIGQHAPGSFRQAGPRLVQQEMTPPPPDHPPPQWGSREPGALKTAVYCIYHDCISPAAPASSLPSWEEYIACLQKIKYGFNLLGQLEKTLTSPSAPDFVHILFTSLGMVVPQYPEDLPPTVLSPLLTESAMRLLSRVVSPEEDQLWRSLGDPWNIPRSRWPDADVLPYIPDFYDGWQPPAPSRMPSPHPQNNEPLSRSNSQRFPPGRPNGQINESRSYSPRAIEPPLYMRVIYDFMARNNQELSIMKGDVVQVIQKSKQWWLVRNGRDEEGNVPQNVLEPMKNWETRSPVTLDMSSTSAEVKAWLQYKGFSRITVTSLGVLTGKLLLGMSKDEIRTVCPEEGGKVFFQLQAVKSAIAYLLYTYKHTNIMQQNLRYSSVKKQFESP
uniref:EPS8 signaling adaptor L3b n=1 Tax=Seriola dumerili TaxID=41447 RepID=A0A3B4TYT9_SERDU